jgi:hypothetical protein
METVCSKRSSDTTGYMLSGGQAELYCAKRVPGFRGFVAGAVDPAMLDPELSEQLAGMDRWVTGHIIVPIPPGARRETTASSECSTDDRGELIARFVISDPTWDAVAFYSRWAQHDGWFVEGVLDHGIFGMVTLVKGTHCANLCYKKSDTDMSLSIRLWRQTYVYRG